MVSSWQRSPGPSAGPVIFPFGGRQSLARTPGASERPGVSSFASGGAFDDPKLRVALGGTACYTRVDFLAHFSTTSGAALWDPAQPPSDDDTPNIPYSDDPPDTPELQVAPDGATCYTRGESLAIHGNRHGPALWECAAPPLYTPELWMAPDGTCHATRAKSLARNGTT